MADSPFIFWRLWEQGFQQIEMFTAIDVDELSYNVSNIFGIIYCWLFNWSFVLLILVQNFKDFFFISAAKFFNLYYLFYFWNIPLSIYSLMTIYNNILNLSKKTIVTNNTEIFIILEEMEIGHKLFMNLSCNNKQILLAL